MKILVLGSGGREHAIVHTLHRQGHSVYCLPGNGGTEGLCEKNFPKGDAFDVENFSQIASFVEKAGIDLTVVGPEDLLEKGIGDFFAARNLPLFGPNKSAAQIESSKVWAKRFMTRHNIPTANYVICTDSKEAVHSLKECFKRWKGVVIKPSGLTGGKGVVCCKSFSEGRDAIAKIMEDRQFGAAGQEIVLEEMLIGEEVSLLAFCDGKIAVPMPPSQDHKRLFDNDLGPNTGGLGSYAPYPFFTSSDMDALQATILSPTIKGLQQENIFYKGVLYAGLMMTKEGPKVLEYNCRFGDPETQVLLPLLDSDLSKIMLACQQGRLNPSEVRWKKQSACCVVMASGGYPHAYNIGTEIFGLNLLSKEPDIFVFHAGTCLHEQGRFETSGGRVLGITGVSHTLQEAVAKAYEGVEKVRFHSAHFRKDIARKALKKIQHKEFRTPQASYRKITMNKPDSQKSSHWS